MVATQEICVLMVKDSIPTVFVSSHSEHTHAEHLMKCFLHSPCISSDFNCADTKTVASRAIYHAVLLFGLGQNCGNFGQRLIQNSEHCIVPCLQIEGQIRAK